MKLSKLLTPKDSTPSEENEMLMSLLDIFASNDLINFGFFDKMKLNILELD